MLEIRWPTALLIAVLSIVVRADVADYDTKPKGENPTLYEVGTDPVVQLDETTFSDTVYCAGRADCTSFLVEFYSDWCGHCRAYAPLYKNLARDVRGWNRVVRVAAMNCADAVNEATCKANGVMFFPFIKYFPRNGTSVDDAIKLKTYQSGAQMRDQLAERVQAEYAQHKYEDWPIFDHLPQITTYSQIFENVSDEIKHIALVFEEDAASLIGTELLLDLSNYKNQLASRRVRKGHALSDALHLTDYPTVVVYKRGHNEPVMQAELRRLLLAELEQFLRNESGFQGLQFSSHPKNLVGRISDSGEQDEANQPKPDPCKNDPASCQAKFFVSESDMLKAMRYALLREVSRNGGDLNGQNLTSLYVFLDTLANHFPHTTLDNSIDNSTEIFLNASSRARVVFTHMRDFIKHNGLEKPIPVDAWKSEWMKAEEDQGKPFPTTSDWQHCRGSAPQFRGYTCGLWTTFHALTVRAYKDGLVETEKPFKPDTVLKSIRGWVAAFFGCEHCRQHFLKMTTRTFNMDKHVHKPEDSFMYLWKAHNIVNNRLKGRDTEDPDFPKRQFPAPFLCSDCGTGLQSVDETRIQKYLLNYYSSIRPVDENTEVLEAIQ